MKKLITTYLLLLLAIGTQAQYVTIPDSNFVKFLQAKFPTAMNGNQMDTTATAITMATNINCNNQEIENIHGIQFFDSLLYLDCSYNKLVVLPKLQQSVTSLECSNNQLTALSILPLALCTLACNNNNLSTLPKLPSTLKGLQCGTNNIKNLPSLPDTLVYLACYFNMLDSLPILPRNLRKLYCWNNRLTSLPLMPSKLESLYCNDNLLTSLPNFPKNISSFYCTNNTELACLPPFTQSLFVFFGVKQNTKITCLPRSVTIQFQDQDSSAFLPLCQNSSPCRSYYNILGNVHVDTSNDCTSDSLNNGSNVSGIKILGYLGDSLKWQSYTNANGLYTLRAEIGDSVVIRVESSRNYQVTCPVSKQKTAIVTAQNSSFSNMDFGIKCITSAVDLGVSSIFGSFRPTRNRPVYIQAGDVSRQFGLNCADDDSGTVTTIIDGSASYVAPLAGALIPTSISGDTLTYSIADFGAVDPKTAFNILVHTDSNATIGSDICIKTIVSTSASDSNSANDTLLFCAEVVNSYDPNDKAAYPKGDATPNSWITYTIRYQNTGTDTAYQIIIRDTLSEYLDESTFTYLDGSVRPIINLSEKAIMFNLPDINLLDSFSNEPESHGWLQYKVKTKSDLPPFAEVKNTAFIYFDLNSPVVTNTTVNEYITRSSLEITSCDSADVNGTTYYTSQTVIDTAGANITTTELIINSVDSETTLSGTTISSKQDVGVYQWLDCNDSYSPITSAIQQSYAATKNGEYAVEVAANGCIDTSDCVSIVTLNTTEKNLGTKFRVYPNPMKGNFTIEFDQNKTSIEARLLSYTGQEIETIQVSSTNELSHNLNVPSGLYFLEVSTDTGNKSVVKILKH